MLHNLFAFICIYPICLHVFQKMNEQDTIIAGNIGFWISTFLWLLCTWRLWFHSSWECFGRPSRDGDNVRRRYHSLSLILAPPSDIEQRQHEHHHTVPFIRWLTRRRAFHGLLWYVCRLFEYISHEVLFEKQNSKFVLSWFTVTLDRWCLF